MIMNRKCNYCGNEYYICRSCIRAGNAWKNVCCSRECFIALMETMDTNESVNPIITNKENDMKTVILRGELKSGLTVDVTGCDFDLGRFDCTDGKTYVYEDFKFFYITPERIKEIIGTIKHQTETKTKAINQKQTKKAENEINVSEKED